MTNSQPIGKYQNAAEMTTVVSEEEDIEHADPLRLNPTEDKVAADNEEHLDVDVKWEDDVFEDIVEEEDFRMEECELAVKDLSEKEQTLVLNTRVLDEQFEQILAINANKLETGN